MVNRTEIDGWQKSNERKLLSLLITLGVKENLSLVHTAPLPLLPPIGAAPIGDSHCSGKNECNGKN